MSIVHVQRIKRKLMLDFENLIDIRDVENRNDKEKENAFLTRSLAAFAISTMCNIEPDNAAKHVTDGPQDNGIDAIYFDEREKKLLLVQSKWHHEGNGSIEKGDCLKFINGVKDLMKLDFSAFNEKVNS